MQACAFSVVVATLLLGVLPGTGVLAARGPDLNRTVFTAEYNLRVFDINTFNSEINAVIAPIECNSHITDDRSDGVAEFIEFHLDCRAKTVAAQDALRAASPTTVMSLMHTNRGLEYTFVIIPGTDERGDVEPAGPIVCITALALVITGLLVFARKRKHTVDQQFRLRDQLSSLSEEMRPQ